MSRQPPVQQPPPVQRVRLRYAKRGRARFASHRDFARAFERALRRAEVPMAYSSGFSPHPRISYANAAPTLAASEAEYLEIALARRCDPEGLRAGLNAALPDGLAIVAAVEADGAPLADLLTHSQWLLELPAVPSGVLSEAVAALLARDEAIVERLTKNGARAFDVRPAIVELRVTGEGRAQAVLAMGSPLVRPDDVVAALSASSPAMEPSVPVFTRLAQGAWDGARVADPFGAVAGHGVKITVL